MPDRWKRPSPKRVARIRDRLRETYGIPRMAPHGRPLDELILTVLSQSTNDRNRDVAFLRLRERFAEDPPAADARAAPPGLGAARPVDYQAMLAAPVGEIEEAIRPGGISKVKSARVKAILAAIASTPLPHDVCLPSSRTERGTARPARGTGAVATGRHARLSLEWIRDAPIEQSRAYLCSLPGVGRKTAACVLLFSYGLPDVPVDTHVSRVGTRLGLFREGASFEELHDEMLAITPEGQALELHVNLLRHGRRTCFARNPACGVCPLARMCPSRAQLERGHRARERLSQSA
jgi:endonuclease III